MIRKKSLIPITSAASRADLVLSRIWTSGTLDYKLASIFKRIGMAVDQLPRAPDRHADRRLWIFSFCANSIWLIANSVVAQKHSMLLAVTGSLFLPRAKTCSAAISSNSATRLTTCSKLMPLSAVDVYAQNPPAPVIWDQCPGKAGSLGF